MLQTTTTGAKERSEASRMASQQEPQRILHSYTGAIKRGIPAPAVRSGPARLRQQFAGLQRTIGNQAVLRMLNRSGRRNGQPVAARSFCADSGLSHAALPARVQPKLTVNQPGDQYEQEADRAAEQAMRTPDPAAAPVPNATSSANGKLQRQCACGESGAECEACKEKREDGLLQTETDAPPIVHEVLRSPGQPLDNANRAFFEPRFGADFSVVRVHSDAIAAQSAAAVNALAYTVGRQIVLGADASSGPTRLLAHELAHVVQQTGAARGNGGGSAMVEPQVHRQSTTAADMNPGTQGLGDADISSDEGQNPDSQIEYTTQGPSDAGSGAATGQNLEQLSGALSTTTSPEITLETGNVGAGPINNAVHQQICVDTTGQSGKRCFSFAATGPQLPQFSSTWLGWDSTVVGAILQGMIYAPGPVPGATVVSRHSPTAAQASNWLSYMRGTRLGLQDGYSVARHNCRTFSQWEFRDAPSHW